jgi:hypothetical protein
VLENSCTPKPIVKHLETTVNARGLMEGNGWVRPPSELRGFTVFHRFDFTTNSAGDSCCEVSFWHYDPKPEMLLLSGKPGGFLKAGVDLNLYQELVPPMQRKEVPKDATAKMRLRLAAVERRVNSSSAMTSLRALVRNLEAGDASECSWDMGSCAESKGQYTQAALLEPKAHGAAALQCTVSVETGEFDLGERPLSDMKYSLGEIVVLRPSEKAYGDFG